jgi:hypothetical protein
MKTNYLLNGIITLLLLVSCEKKEDKYPTFIVRNYDFELNGSPWTTNVDLSTRQIIVYDNAGTFRANYMTYYRFALEEGSYKFLASPAPAVITSSLIKYNLNDLVIPQPTNADTHLQLSPAVSYSTPFSDTLHLRMVNRTGTLRLKAKDLTADLSYTTVRAIATVQNSGYKAVDETYVESSLELTRSKATATGGVNYTEDFIVFNTVDDQHKVSVRLELLDAEGQVIRTKELTDKYEILPDAVTIADFYLNE